MKMHVTGRQIEITNALRDALHKKLGKLDKYFQQSEPEANVTLEVQRGYHIVEVTLFIGGMILRSEDKTTDMYSTIDSVVDKLARQIHKYKTRLNRKMREQGNAPLFVSDDGNDDAEELKVVRTKRFSVKPMNVEEAILQMELLGHNFFVFRHSETDEVNVLYKRKDGNFGLIEPQ
ncbi:ribosome-associated translation inhibitor RaiA [Clostridium sp. 'deep sea']|uniref:ribosome hibernation-promoting factor, HPF/YfiA family n=1 Tax=Clostridium sp. 'deep sea' TaxID=2779445 RepID=UPI00189678E2|nr:ribosome-associated translation inhibitor RaiA [Clostridium sp. 'deep sea']QOR33689.1 ribosome-associated translation inhibitor RaiA [Clostridium sp. 'deep sea']